MESRILTFDFDSTFDASSAGVITEWIHTKAESGKMFKIKSITVQSAHPTAILSNDTSIATLLDYLSCQTIVSFYDRRNEEEVRGTSEDRFFDYFHYSGAGQVFADSGVFYGYLQELTYKKTIYYDDLKMKYLDIFVYQANELLDGEDEQGMSKEGGSQLTRIKIEIEYELVDASKSELIYQAIESNQV